MKTIFVFFLACLSCSSSVYIFVYTELAVGNFTPETPAPAGGWIPTTPSADPIGGLEPRTKSDKTAHNKGIPQIEQKRCSLFAKLYIFGF